MSYCAVHGPGCEPCDETAGWKAELCTRVYEALGEPSIEPPSWSAVYALTATVMRWQDNQHPEAQAYAMHLEQVHPVAAHG